MFSIIFTGSHQRTGSGGDGSGGQVIYFSVSFIFLMDFYAMQ